MDDKLTSIVTALHRIQAEDGQETLCVFTANIKKNYYVQLVAERGQTTVHGEAVSNKFLAPEYALTANQMAKLQALAWNRPGAETDQTPNFYRHWEITNEAEQLAVAKIILRTLEEVYGLSANQPLTVKFRA